MELNIDATQLETAMHKVSGNNVDPIVIQQLLAYSQAISLKRIADSLDAMTKGNNDLLDIARAIREGIN